MSTQGDFLYPRFSVAVLQAAQSAGTITNFFIGSRELSGVEFRISANNPHEAITLHRSDWTDQLTRRSTVKFGQEVDIVHPADECAKCEAYRQHVLHPEPDFGFVEDIDLGQAEDAFLEGVLQGQRTQREKDEAQLARYREKLDCMQQELHDSQTLQTQYQDEAEGLKAELAGVQDRLFALQLAYEELSSDTARLHRVAESSSPIRDVPHDVASPDTGSVSPSSSSVSWPGDEDFFEEDDEFGIMQQLHLMDEWDREDAEWAERIRREAIEEEDEGEDEVTSSFFLGAISIESDLGTPSPASSVLDLSKPEPQDERLTISQLSALIAASEEPPKREAALLRLYPLVRAAERTPKEERSLEQAFLLASWNAPTVSTFHISVSSPRPSTSALPPSSPITRRKPLPQIFVDASAYGVGLIFDNFWLAWTFTPDHPLIPLGPDDKIIMSWAELIAVELGVLTLLAAGHQNVKITLRSDNEGVVMALKKRAWTPRFGLNDILQRVLRLCDEGEIDLRPLWIWTKKNPADGPSRGVYPERWQMFKHQPDIPKHLAGFLQAVEPSIPTV
ncbi:hypothetical protein NLJ89_g9015 [Agrocybe chaxingu]|uniref:Uncharacterized protein n=1 Tax=Agrocybe chaxingu TaxID=84603 RepID=A0A9W8JTA7_9AGAR|nr:hypothetical protein NLJ89_g9015 [Agrocybe chaxingu]